jgi:uncharacterized membrane protein YdfJ with MMPL/SSD domain
MIRRSTAAPLAFRSLVIPAKAIAMNLLSVGAAYGLVVATFQADVGPAWLKDFAAFLGSSSWGSGWPLQSCSMPPSCARSSRRHRCNCWAI